MIHYIDQRQLTAAYLTSDGRLLLNDEPLPDEFPTTQCLLADWDVEAKIFKLTGERGAPLPSDPTAREALRAALQHAIASPLQVITLREAKLREAADAYVNQIPIMTDASYDSVWREHKQARVDQPWLFDTSNPRCLFPDGTILDRVGAAPAKDSGFERVRHGNPMKSIDDVFEGDGESQYDELLAFVQKMETKLGNHAWPMLVQPKVDGMAVKLIYRNGLLALGLTRGDGEVGDDITDNIRITQMVPESVAPDVPWNGTQAHPLNADPLEIVGEVYMSIPDFERANAEREAEGLDLWKNPRNAASGSMKLQDAAELRNRPLSFVRHDGYTPWIDGIKSVTSIEVFDWEKLIEAVETIRNSGHVFAIDGAVIKLAPGHGREVLGMGTRSPNWACAFKFKPVQTVTTLEDVVVQVGRSGVLTPKARLAPVEIDGTTVTHATLNNEAWIQEMGLRIGDTVVLQKAGAIIPEITMSTTRVERRDALTRELEVKHPNDSGEMIARHMTYLLSVERPPFSLIDHLGGKCPSCGSTDLQKQVVETGEGAKWKCMNASGCPAQLSRRIEHMCSRGCLDIEGIGKEAAIAIAAEGITGLLDLFAWGPGDFAGLTWTTAAGSPMTFGRSRAVKAYDGLMRAKSLPLHRWLRALGIPTIGENTSKEISRLCRDFQEVKDRTGNLGVFDLIKKDTAKDDPWLKEFSVSSHLGPVSCRHLFEFIWANLDLWERLTSFGIKSDNYDPTPQASDAKPLFGKSFAITGTLSVGRDEMKALIESKGGKVSGSVSKKTSYLVAGEGGGQKADKAREAGVEILTEAALRAML
jgi:DNA ligase (NAD+)